MTPMTFAGFGLDAPKEQRPSSALDPIFGQAEGWTAQQFGIAARGVAGPDETTSMMGAEAARRALAMAGWQASDLDVLIGACGVMEQPIPGTSVLIQEALGLGKSGIWAFDVNQTCLSFVTALDVVVMGFESGRFRRALIVSSDIASAGLDWEAPHAAAIFGDGAAAVCVEAGGSTDGPGLLARGFETYGEGKDLATLRSGGTRVRIEHGLEALAEGARFHMDAFGIFKAAARCMPDLVDRVLADAGLTRETVDLVVPHQASAPALEHARRLMGGDPERVIDIFASRGNQIAASLPTALTEAHARGLLTPGKTVLLLGTAAGISAAAMVIRT
jgi:3-oxoacyl-[acyl-carrier-protein] synthase III